jgi:DNA repair protein RadA/Sms
MIVAVLGRHAGLSLGTADVFVNVAGGVRIEEPGADLAVALAIASASRGVPLVEGAAAFGEIGLTGRLRPAAQAERRLEECAKLGIAVVLAPLDSRERGGLRISGAETLRAALSAALPRRVKPSAEETEAELAAA